MIKAKKSRGLGRGLDVLLGPDKSNSNLAHTGEVLQELLVSQLQAGAYQPRTHIDEGALYELAQSIKTQGLMQPILVRALQPKYTGQAQPPGLQEQANPLYEIVAGERRLHAAKIAGLERVPALVRKISDENAAVMALIENIQREDLTPLEEAQGMQRLIDEFGFTHAQVAQTLGRSRSAASNLLRLLQLTGTVQTMLQAGDLDMGHARALLGLNKAQQITTANKIIARKMSVRDAEKLVKAIDYEQDNSIDSKTQGVNKKSHDVLRIEEELSDFFTSSVELRMKKRGKKDGKLKQQGEIVIAFASMDELNGLIERLRQR